MPVDFDLGDLGIDSRFLQQFGCEINACDTSTDSRCGDGNDTRPARHVENSLTRPYTCMPHQPSRGSRCECFKRRKVRPAFSLHFFERRQWIHTSSLFR
jgi:hypothetical protein